METVKLNTIEENAGCTDGAAVGRSVGNDRIIRNY